MYRNLRLTIFLIGLTLNSHPCLSFSIPTEELQFLKMYYTSKEMVYTTTRSIKPLSRVAENVTVITAKDIRKMGAHTLSEVLNQIPGIFVNFSRDFGATSFIYMQGAKNYHTLVLVDGIRWNILSERHAETNSIPVEIIERIEIIKGPASSSWGSSLGGVVNIITRHLDLNDSPAGTFWSTFGEKNTSDLRAGFTGRIDKGRYYLYAGKQDSDGLRGGAKI